MNDKYKSLLEGPRIWRLNRKQYPGWIVAPRHIRRRLWDHTKRWVDPLAAIDSSYTPFEKLFALRELNWRLEVALLPLFTNLAETVQSTLLEIELSEIENEVIQFPSTEDREGHRAEEEYLFSRTEIEASWKELTFALLRFKREERHFNEFEAWTSKLSDLPSITNDEEARVCYEKALLAFGCMDDVAVARALNCWPKESSLMWRVRKASVFAQLGQIEEASLVAKSALERIQQSARNPTDDQFLISLEGWAVMLLRAIHDQFPPPEPKKLDDEIFRKELDRRIRQLKRLKYDPWELIEDVTEFEKWPQPTFTLETEKIGFQPNEVSVTRHLGKDIFRALAPAYEVMRFSEIAPFPPSLGNINLCKSSLRSAGIWLISHDPVRTDSLLFHLLDEKLLDAYLSRHRVAAMSQEVVRQTYDLAYRGVDQALKSEAGGNPLSMVPQAFRNQKRLVIGVEIIARLAVQLQSLDDLSNLWDFAVALYKSNSVTRGWNAYDSMKELFRSLFISLPVNELQKRFKDVVELPIPMTEGFPVRNSYSWPYLVTAYSRKVPGLEHVDPGDWIPQVSDLLQKATNDNLVVRKRALLRLSEMWRYGCLNEKQQQEFARLYWADLDEYELPNTRGFRRSACLRLPAPNGINVIERFKNFALTVGDASTPSELNEKIVSLIQATTVGSDEGEDCHGRINWTTGEITRMLELTQASWNQIKDVEPDAGIRLTANAMTGEDSVQVQVENILLALRDVITPRLKSPEESQVVANMVKDIQASGYPIGVMLPVLGKVDEKIDVEAIARFGLASHDKDEYLSSLKGLAFWGEFAGTRISTDVDFEIPEIPLDVIRELGVIIANRRQPFLDQAILAASIFAASTETTLDNRFLSSLLFGLKYLLKELEYRWADEVVASIEYDDVPNYRRYVVRLANALYNKHGISDEAVLDWLESGSTDPLPEVRREVTVSPPSGIGRSRSNYETTGAPEEMLKSLLKQRTSSRDLDEVLQRVRRIEIDVKEGKEPDLKLAAILVSKVAKLMQKACKMQLLDFLTTLLRLRRNVTKDLRLELFDIALRDDAASPDQTYEWLIEFYKDDAESAEEIRPQRFSDA